MTTLPSTKAKTEFGKLIDTVNKRKKQVIVTKNDLPYVVVISIDEYEDFLETQDVEFNKTLEKASKEIKSGKKGSLDNLYQIHRETIAKEAK